MAGGGGEKDEQQGSFAVVPYSTYGSDLGGFDEVGVHFDIRAPFPEDLY